ncbi:hypothetical protein BHM03_00004723 [Ensete ventricosum]|nr:hypothetical protein BHM03_00004723 [Ensete ventricosum]
MFSRWEFSRSSVIKRVCKFLLKKKLGEVILGDIDLDQLDVQLSTGTIHLTDLALNVDFLNQKVIVSSQVYPASGRIWNWTCSVFNAISVASNLASGIGDVPKGSNVRQELILSSSFLLQIQLSRVSINLDNHDFKLLNCLLNNLIDGYSGAAIGVDVCVDSSIKNKFLSSSNASQTTILVKCDVLDASIRLNEVIEVSPLIQKELQGSWNYFKLKVDKFELLSVSNTGGVGDAKFLWLNHGEGELWGSVISNVEKSGAVAEEFLLITCRNSAMRRGNGEGANALMFGPAGTAVTNMWNPLSQQSYTSIMVRCGTVIAPGGRLDWISAIFSYFSSCPREKGNDGTAGKLLFFLDLVDVALSYEPHNKQSAVSSEDRDCQHDCDVEPDKEIDKVCTACLLAAASLSLSHHTKSDTTFDYNIHLKDVGFLICESTGSFHDIGDYCVGYLQKAGYCKVAQVSFLLAILRIRGMFWEIECSDSHIDLESCHDTTFGLFRLVSQLQQLYALDVEDALVHLQSRWNAIHLVDKDRNTNYIAEVISSNSAGSGFELSTSNEEHQISGLLDEILENVFEGHTTSDHCGTHSHVSLEQCQLGDMLNVKVSRADDAFAANILDSGSSCSAELGQTLKQPVNRTYTSQVIESYYASDMLASSPVPITNCSFSEDGKCIESIDISSHKDTEHRQGGWYLDDGLMILEDHISTNLNQAEGKSLQPEGEFGADNFYAADCCLPNGRVILKNMNARWCMYAGHDWTKPKGVPVCSVTQNGRDRSTFLELSLVGLYLQYDVYPEGVTYVSKCSLSIQDFQLYDRSSDAPWKMV